MRICVGCIPKKMNDGTLRLDLMDCVGILKKVGYEAPRLHFDGLLIYSYWNPENINYADVRVCSYGVAIIVKASEASRLKFAGLPNDF